MNPEAYLTVTSVLSGFTAAEFIGSPYIAPIYPMVQKLTRQNPMQKLSEEQAIKSEIERLTQLYESKIAREYLAPLTDDETCEEHAKQGDYHRKGGCKNSPEISETPKNTPEDSEAQWESADLSQSTAESIQALIEKVKAKKAEKNSR